MNSNLCVSVDGGGMLGIGPAWYLTRLEIDLGAKLCNRIVAQAGTSTGSIIAALLAEGKSANEIFTMYKTNMKKIFTKYSLWKRMSPKCPTYDNTNLKKLLKENLVGLCSQWTKPTFIPTTFMNGKSEEKVWDNDDCYEKWFAVLTSCSAPTYFDVVEEAGNSYCDGGMWANSPEDILMAGMFKRGHKDIRILSFGTGMEAPNTEKGNQNTLGWLSYILDEWVARSGNASTYRCQAVLGEENVLRLKPNINKKIKMDDIDRAEEVRDIWDKYYEQTREDVLKFVKG